MKHIEKKVFIDQDDIQTYREYIPIVEHSPNHSDLDRNGRKSNRSY